MSNFMTKPTKLMCAQKRLGSAWASAQSDQSFRCPQEETWVLSYPLSAQQRLLRLGGCRGWSESPLGAHASLLVLSVGCSNFILGFKAITLVPSLHPYIQIWEETNTPLIHWMKYRMQFSSRAFTFNWLKLHVFDQENCTWSYIGLSENYGRKSCIL